MEIMGAMKQALEALEQLQGGCTDSDDGTVEAITVWCPEVIDALRQAIEQAQQAEPVAWALNFELLWPSEYEIISKDGDKAIPLYTSPPPRQPLTDEEIRAVYGDDLQYRDGDYMRFARAIEAAHGITGGIK
jgi:hypothetical protein